MTGVPWQTRELAEAYDVLAPDTSEIRLLGQVRGGSMVHCTLRPGQVSVAVRHRTVEEIWYVIGGRAALWRTCGDLEEIVEITTGDCVTIPLGTHFQFRTLGSEPFTFVMCTMPPWPGEGEAVRVPGRWEEGGRRKE